MATRDDLMTLARVTFANEPSTGWMSLRRTLSFALSLASWCALPPHLRCY